MSNRSNQINSIIKSRNVVIEMLEYRGYDILEISNNNNDIYDKYINNNLDIFLDHKCEDKSILIHYIDNSNAKLGIKVLKNILNNITNNTIGNIKIKDNTIDIIILTNDPITDVLLRECYNYYENSFTRNKKGIYIQLFEFKSLLFNITKCNIVPKHIIITEEEFEKEIKIPYNVNKATSLPIINKSDPVAMFIGLRPKQTCRINRVSETAGLYNNYRYCK